MSIRYTGGLVTSANTIGSVTPTVEYLVVAGGGASSSQGGAGAGGVLQRGGYVITQAVTYTVTIGAGGAVGNYSCGGQFGPITTGITNIRPYNGCNSSFGTGAAVYTPATSGLITAYGGGYGGFYDAKTSSFFCGGSGGSGGGTHSQGSKTGGSGTACQGNSGGTARCATGGYGGGGGGGAGGTPAGGTTYKTGANPTGEGGTGVMFLGAATGRNIFGGGGGGGSYQGYGGIGGPGGGGTGHTDGYYSIVIEASKGQSLNVTQPQNPTRIYYTGTSGAPNTGGGAGGTINAGSFNYSNSTYSPIAPARCNAPYVFNPTQGGSGIVVLRYLSLYALPQATTGNPTVSYVGPYRTYTFTSSGSITF